MQSANSPQIPGTFHTTFESLMVFKTTILALNCLVIRTKGVFSDYIETAYIATAVVNVLWYHKNEWAVSWITELTHVKSTSGWGVVVLCLAIQYSLKIQRVYALIYEPFTFIHIHMHVRCDNFNYKDQFLCTKTICIVSLKFRVCNIIDYRFYKCN